MGPTCFDKDSSAPNVCKKDSSDPKRLQKRQFRPKTFVKKTVQTQAAVGRVCGFLVGGVFAGVPPAESGTGVPKHPDTQVHTYTYPNCQSRRNKKVQKTLLVALLIWITTILAQACS